MKLIIDIDDNVYELLNKTGITIDWDAAVHGKEKDRKLTFAIFDLITALRNGKPYDERPQGKWIKKQVTPASCTYVCSECGIEEVILGNFCCWCGADMRKGGAE